MAPKRKKVQQEEEEINNVSIMEDQSMKEDGAAIDKPDETASNEEDAEPPKKIRKQNKDKDVSDAKQQVSSQPKESEGETPKADGANNEIEEVAGAAAAEE